MYSSSIIKEDDQEKKTKVIKAGLKGVLAKIGLSADVDKTVIENVSTSAENINRTYIWSTKAVTELVEHII